MEDYPEIDQTGCSGPDDCDGECRFFATGLKCDEDDGPYLHLQPICPDNVVSLQPTDPGTPPAGDGDGDGEEDPRVPQDDGADNSKMAGAGSSIFN